MHCHCPVVFQARSTFLSGLGLGGLTGDGGLGSGTLVDSQASPLAPVTLPAPLRIFASTPSSTRTRALPHSHSLSRGRPLSPRKGAGSALCDIRRFFYTTPSTSASSSTTTPSSSSSSSSSLSSLPSPSGVLASSPPPSITPLPLLLPLTDTLLFNVPEKLLLPVLAFNLAVWQYRLPSQAARLEHDVVWLVNRIVEVATLLLTSIKSVTRKKKKVVDIEGEREVHDGLIRHLTASTAVCYSDGSASPNPGPCGAGATVFLRDPDQVIDLGASLGRGTNNLAEIVGLELIFTKLCSLKSVRPSLQRAIVFCDSKLALRVAASRKESKTNVEVSQRTRGAFLAVSKLLSVELHWIRGHVGLGGNERVDRISKAFASTRENQARRSTNFGYLSLCRCSVWSPSFPLVDLPLSCFLTNLLVPGHSSDVSSISACASSPVRLRGSSESSSVKPLVGASSRAGVAASGSRRSARLMVASSRVGALVVAGCEKILVTEVKLTAMLF